MDYKALVTIGDIPLPEPSTYQGNTSTLVNSGRNTQGVLIGAVVREDMAKVSLTWRYLTVDQWAMILQLFNEKQGGKFFNQVTFFDQTIGDYTTREMYVSDRKAGMWRRGELGEILGWTNCSLNLVEV